VIAAAGSLAENQIFDSLTRSASLEARSQEGHLKRAELAQALARDVPEANVTTRTSRQGTLVTVQGHGTRVLLCRRTGLFRCLILDVASGSTNDSTGWTLRAAQRRAAGGLAASSGK
jgi:hypothetical protein